MQIKQIKVKNMTSDNGNSIPNQFVIRVKTHDVDQAGFDEMYFQSYDSIIVKMDIRGHYTLDTNKWNYSRTTSKYRSLFLDEDTKTTEKKIKDGTYTLADLNQ